MSPQIQSPYSTHDEAWLLLPWYVNGSLTEDETRLVKNHLRVCLTCRKELAEQQPLAKKLQHGLALEISATPSLERLMARIQSVDGQAAATGSPKNPEVSYLSRLDSIFSALTAKRLSIVFVSMLLALILPYAAEEKPRFAAQQFHTAADTGSLEKFGRNDIRVIFADQLKKEQIEALLVPLHGYIVQGPSPSKIYTVRIGDPDQSGKLTQSALDSLRADKVVIWAEPGLPRNIAVTKGIGVNK